MNIELKNVKIHPDLSQETNCFSATIYLDGKKIGTVENRGTGGAHFYHWIDRPAGKRLEEWAQAQPLAFDFEKLDQIIDAALTTFEAVRWLKRNTKRQTVFSVQGDAPGAWRTIGRPFSPIIKAHLVKTYGDTLACIANEDVDAAAAMMLAK